MAREPSLVTLAVVAPVAASVAASAMATILVAAGAILAAVVVLSGAHGVAGSAGAAAVVVGSAAAAGAAAVRASGEEALLAALRSGERERGRRRALEARSRVDRLEAALAGCGSLGEVAEAFFAVAAEELGAAAGLLGLLEPAPGLGSVLRIRHAQGYRPEVCNDWGTTPLDPRLPSTVVVLEGRPVFAPMVEVFARRWPAVAGAVRAAGYPSLCILPVWRAGEARGVLALSWPSRRRFPEEDRQTLLLMAEHVGAAVERAVANETQRRARRRQALVAEVTRILAGSLDVGVGTRRLVELLASRLVDGAVVVVPAAQWPALGEPWPAPGQGSPGSLRPLASAHRSLRAAQVLGAACPSGHGDPEVEPVVSLVEQAWREGTDQELALVGGGQVLALPMSTAGTTLGVLVLVAGLSAPVLGIEERVLVREIAARAAGAADLARRFARQQHLAMVLQRSLLPAELPVVPGLVLAADYRPGTAGAEVGGDWFDAVVLGDGRVLVGVGDVAGKGVAAATVMSQLRTGTRAYALLDPRPDRVLDRLDRLLTNLALGEAGIATMVLALVDPSRRTLLVASAGHPPALVVGPRGVRVLWEGRRPLLGAPVAHGPGGPGGADLLELALDPGETLVLYSDGLVERRGQPISEGIEWLAALAAERARRPTWPTDAARELLRADEARDVEDDAVVLSLTLQPASVALDRVPQPGGWLGPVVASLELPSRPASVPAARAWLRGQLADRPPEERQRAELLVDELVANAVLHAGTTLRVALRRGPSLVHVEVADDSRALPYRKLLGREAATGRGLLLLDQLADDWGVVAAPGGKAIWFELGTSAAGRPVARLGPRLVLGSPGLRGPAPGQRPTLVVELRGLPLGQAHAALGYYEALVRELRLVRDDPNVPGELAAQAVRLKERGGAVLGALAPALGGWPPGPLPHPGGPVDLRIEVAADTGQSAAEVSDLLDALEEAARAGLVLLPPPPRELACLRRWVLGEVARQARGEPPRPWRAGVLEAPGPLAAERAG